MLTLQVTTLIGDGTNASTDGTGTAAQFASPKGLTTDGTNLYVGEACKIRKIVLSTSVVSTLADPGCSTDNILSLAIDKDYLYYTQYAGNQINRVSKAGGTVESIAGTYGIYD